MKNQIFLQGIIRESNGQETVFSTPAKGDVSMHWTLSEAEGVTVCRVSGSCPDGFDGKRGLVLRPVGMDPKKDFMAIQNHSPFWCRPLFGNDLSALPTEGTPLQALLIRVKDTFWQYWLPICDDTFKTVIFGCKDGLEFCTYSNVSDLTACDNQLAFVYAEGKDPFELTRRCAKAAAVLLGNGLRMREERQVPEVFEYLGWCSWDSMQIRVSHEGLLEKAREFQEKKVPVHFAIIDDMWADCPHLKEIPQDASFRDMVVEMHKSTMRTFEGDPERFPKGMASAIADLKAAGIPKVGIWFPVTGYWAGMDPDGEAAEISDLLAPNAKGQLNVIPETDKAFAFYNRFCSRVRSWGGDFVKIDNQSFHDSRYFGLYPIGQSARAIQSALDSTTASHFGGSLINCMGMTSECMFNRPTSPVSRCSDDFLPENRKWFAKHILQCSYNGLLQGQYYVNDWDMWWTDDEQAVKNSVCRAISGGPIYVSDKIGRTNPEILYPLALSNGRILRPDHSATPTADCLIEDPTVSGKIFKIRNSLGKNGLVAVFNIDAENRSVSGILRPTDAYVSEGDYAYYEYFTGECGILRRGDSLPVTLADNDEFRLYTFVPHETGKPAVFGRIDKMIGVGAVTEQSDRSFSLLEGGTVGIYSETPIRAESGGCSLPVESKGNLRIVSATADNTTVFFR